MSAKPEVDGLRSQFVKRGLVRSLDAAIRDEENPHLKSEKPDILDGGKRCREIEHGESLVPKGRKIEGFSDTGVRQSKEHVVLRGLLTTESKRELMETLSISTEEEVDSVEEDEKSDGSTTEILVKAIKGGAILDPRLPDYIKSSYHILQLGDEIYEAILNQADGENNKFYLIQALEANYGRNYIVNTRWGKVGMKGQNKLHGPYDVRSVALLMFEYKFFEKTKNYWADRREFVCHPECYDWLEMDYSVDTSITNLQPRETKLDWRLAQLISLICNTSMMQQKMLDIGYHAEKLPFKKLSKSTILKGYEILNRISDVIGQSGWQKLEQLSGEFYAVIPHDFAFKCKSVIDTPYKLQCKLDMVEALGEIEVATKLFKDDAEMQEDPLYSKYQCLHCELTPVCIDFEEFSMIEQYVQNTLDTYAETSDYTVDILHIFKVSREGEVERFRKFSSTKNRMLLWHGSQLTSWTGILSQGLQIAPPEAPVMSYMFGKGVYFDDMFSSSAEYCDSSRSSRAGVLLLCEVALGDMAELLEEKHDADKLPEGKLSTKGVGRTAPEPSMSRELEDGVVVPLGKLKNRPGHQGILSHNKYIVYNVDQIRMRYLIQVKFNFNSF